MDLDKLKYHKKWLEFGFVTEAIILKQNAEFEIGEDPCPEHYRYRSFMNWMKSKTSFKKVEIENFIVLVELDEDQGMASSALGDLFSSKKLTEEQYGMVKPKLAKYGNWTLRKIEREESSRKERFPK